MTRSEATSTRPSLDERYVRPKVPGLVLAWVPQGTRCDCRASLRDGLIQVGRSPTAAWTISEDKLSRSHFQVVPKEGRWILSDLGSSNGTYLNGEALASPQPVNAGAVIRAGECVFTLVDDLGVLSVPDEETTTFGMAGTFYTAAIIHQLRVAARTRRHILLEGESGVGKELAAKAIHSVLTDLGSRGEFLAENSACFAGDDDAVATLFGVEEGVFTGVKQRPGALERAEGGTLFLDEYHNLPPRAQRSLLRFVEDGLLRRLGNKPARSVGVRLIFGTNLDVDASIDDGQLAHDLVARLHRVKIPSLRERVADIPSIFVEVISRSLPPPDAEALIRCLGGPCIERLCLHDFRRGNVRELEDITTVVGARMAEGEAADEALQVTLEANLGPSRSSPPPACSESRSTCSLYELHRSEIIETFLELSGNLSKIEATLRLRGIQVNRRWLAHFLDKWGVRHKRKRQRKRKHDCT